MGAELLLGPMLRHTGETDATVWVETSGPAEVEILGRDSGWLTNVVGDGSEGLPGRGHHRPLSQPVRPYFPLVRLQILAVFHPNVERPRLGGQTGQEGHELELADAFAEVVLAGAHRVPAAVPGQPEHQVLLLESGDHVAAHGILIRQEDPDLHRRLSEDRIGQPAAVTVLRGLERRQLTVVPDESRPHK